VAEGKRFCGGCGQAMPVVAGLAQPEPAAVSGPATAPCAQCGAALTPGKRFCKQCGHAVGEPAPVAPVEAVPSGRDGSRAGEAAAPDLPPTVAVVAQADMPVAAKDESSYISGGPAIAAEPDITHHARDGQETAKTYPQEPVEEDSQTSPTTVPNSTFILPPPVPTGHSKLTAGIAIGAAAIVLAAAGGGWAWYAHAHRSIAPVANAPSESLPSTTAAAPSTAASSTQIAPTGKIDAASIEGQYAYDVIEMPPIRSKLASLLDKESLKDFKARLQVAGPVEHQGEWLVGEGLAPHSGGSDEAAFAINTNSGAIFGVMMTNGDHFRSFGVDAPAKLPSPLLAWYRDQWVCTSGKAVLCTNPLSWTTDETAVDASQNVATIHPHRLGGLWRFLTGRASGGKLDGPLSWSAHQTGAACHDGFVRVPDQGSHYPAPLDGSYHSYEIALFYGNLRENAIARVKAFVARSP